MLSAPSQQMGMPPLYRELWSNPGDGHPGDPLTDVYADEVATVLEARIADRTGVRPASPTSLGQPCEVGQIKAVVPQPIRFDFGTESHLRLVGTVSYSGGTGEERASSAVVHWPAGQSAVYQRDVLAGDAPRVYDRANSTRTEPASTFWADVPADTDLSAVSLQIHTGAGCTYAAPLDFQNTPVNLMDRR